jgi:hypothetical protein
MSDEEKCYRCGYCGRRTAKEGEPLTLAEIKQMNVDWDKAEKVHGFCCPHGAHGAQEQHRGYVTREMALDAGDPSLEGTPI